MFRNRTNQLNYRIGGLSKKKVIVAVVIISCFVSVMAGCGSNEAKESGGWQESSGWQETGSHIETSYTFRYEDYLEEHYYKHGIEMGFDSAEEYLEAANRVIANPNTMTKIEKEDGDMVYYVRDTNEFLVLSTDGYIRTYFCPDSGEDYFNRQ